MLTTLILAAQIAFTSPVHLPISLAGNFGEPRPNHFHGGIDVRTEMVEGKPLFAVAEGYVSRITIGLYGFGNALYIQHPNGTTSVYCHLRGYVPALRQIVSAKRRALGQKDELDRPHNPSDELDIRLRPTDYPVECGQLVAISGNTGHSVAPHLHLEVHNTRSWAMLDPLDFLRDLLVDNTPPQAHAFMAYPQPGEGIFNGFTKNQYFGFGQTFPAWGRVGFGIWADDYMDDTYHHYGIRRTELRVDGNLVFSSNVDSIPMYCNRMVNSWGDYHHRLRSNVWYMKSFLEPGLSIPCITANNDRGIVTFNEERPYHIVYTLTDIYGNKADFSFTVLGTRQHIPKVRRPQYAKVFRWNRPNQLQLPGAQLIVRQGNLPTDVEVSPRVTPRPDAFSDEYIFAERSTPLFQGATLTLRLNRIPADPSRLCLHSCNRDIPVTYHDGWVTAIVKDLGQTYYVTTQN